MAYSILKSAGLVPEEVELLREIDSDWKTRWRRPLSPRSQPFANRWQRSG